MRRRALPVHAYCPACWIALDPGLRVERTVGTGPAWFPGRVRCCGCGDKTNSAYALRGDPRRQYCGENPCAGREVLAEVPVE